MSVSKEPGVAAIASTLAAQKYGLKIVDSVIQDNKHNYTRFLIISKDSPVPPSSLALKSSIVFAPLSDENNSSLLENCLDVIKSLKLKIVRLESRPR